MKRVVITGMGVVSSIGNSVEEVKDSLYNCRSGIVAAPDYVERGFRSRIHGMVQLEPAEHIDRKIMRFMGDAAAFTYLSMEQAIASAGLSEEEVSNPRVGIIVGSGGGSTSNNAEAVRILENRGVRRIGPYMVTRTMASTTSACLATAFKIKGVNYSISSACSTSAHCIGVAMEQIQLGKQDMVFAGGGEELHWTMSCLFDAMGAMSSKYNDTPEKASRAYDKDRDGFVIAGGGGVVVVEELEHAKARGANILAEIVGYGATSDGYDMVAPSGEGALRCMQLALSTVEGEVDYINAHGTSTPVGDVAELKAIRELFGDKTPVIGSTKSLTGHALGAAGVTEAIYSIIMMQNDFIAKSPNIENLDPQAEGFPIAIERQDNAQLNLVMSNSFGFGGTNASLVFKRYEG